MIKKLVKPFKNRNAWSSGDDGMTDTLATVVVVLFLVFFVVITSCAITDYDKEKIAKAVKSTAVDITEDSSNEEVGNEIKLKADLSNLSVEVTGKI